MSKKQKTRKKSGKIHAWRCYLAAEFKKKDDTSTYIERCDIKVNMSNLKKIKLERDVHQVCADWLNDLIEENDYISYHMYVQKWEPIRG